MPKPPKQLSMEEEVWDKKKVAIAVVVFVLILAGFIFAKNYFFPQKNKPTLNQNVKGISTQKLHSFSLPSVDDVSQKIQDLQNQVTHVDVGEIASSSPQIQQIMREIQDLPNLPKNVAKQACISLCSKL
jgi:cytoskeletal protein RodZ